MNKYHERLKLVRGPEMWGYLRGIYKKKRHDHKYDVEPNKKKSSNLWSTHPSTEDRIEALRNIK